MEEFWKKQLESAQVRIGKGSNHFTMNRGSFRYKKRYEWSRNLSKTGVEKSEHTYRVLYKDPKTGNGYFLEGTEKDGLVKVTFGGNAAGVNRYWITLPSDASEEIYGCGETYSELNLKKNHYLLEMKD